MEYKFLVEIVVESSDLETAKNDVQTFVDIENLGEQINNSHLTFTLIGEK